MNEARQYTLLNKDIKILDFLCRRRPYGSVEFTAVHSYADLRPFGFKDITQWLDQRKAPKHRAHIETILKMCGCNDPEGYIKVTHALTLNDTFWVKDSEDVLAWNDVSLFRNEFDETIARIAFEGGLYGNQFSSTSPEFGTDGAMAKCWVRESDHIYLMKRGSSGARNAGLEPYSEMYTYQLAKQICPYAVPYEVVKFRGNLASKCPLFTTESNGFAAIYRVLGENTNLDDLMDYYTSIGSEDDFRRMLVLDALTLNTDRHRGNFGILFNTDTMEPVRMAPVFDNNQALLPYAEREDFLNMDSYMESRSCRIGIDFNQTAHAVLTPEIKSDLRNLRGFRFDRETKYQLPEERLCELEKMVHVQIDNILHEKLLYVPAMESAGK